MAATNTSIHQHWLYPPALPSDFLQAIKDQHSYPWDQYDVLKAAAARGSFSENGTFGSNNVEVRVGDGIMPEWNTDYDVGAMSVGLYCLVCQEGKGMSANGFGVWGGCDNCMCTFLCFRFECDFSPFSTPFTFEEAVSGL